MLSAFFAFLAGAPLALIGPTGLTPTQFGFVPVATSSFYLVGGWVVLRSTDSSRGRSWALVIAWGAAFAGASILVGFATMGRLADGVFVNMNELHHGGMIFYREH